MYNLTLSDWLSDRPCSESDELLQEAEGTEGWGGIRGRSAKQSRALPVELRCEFNAPVRMVACAVAVRTKCDCVGNNVRATLG